MIIMMITIMTCGWCVNLINTCINQLNVLSGGNMSIQRKDICNKGNLMNGWV